MKQARGAPTSSSSGSGSNKLNIVSVNSSFYLQPNSPLKTVFEDSPPELRATNRAKYENNLIRGPPGRNLKLQRHSNRSPTSSNGRRARPQKLALSGTPSALLHNDWYLNQLFDEVAELYKPGALSGYPIFSRNHIASRPLALLRELAPGQRVQPLFPSIKSSSPERISSRHPSYHHSQTLSFYSTKPLPMPPKRKAVGGGRRKDLYSDEKHIFSAKSKLLDEDLHQFFASPLAWSSLSEEEKEEIRGLLPPGIPYDESGAPEQSWLRYDEDWRHHVSRFAEDLAEGKFEPEWLDEAREAAEQRRRGDFDTWKEEQFEEFWGQKSDAHADIMAGEAIKIKLSEMVGAGVFKLGDVFAYSRAFGKSAKDGYLIEKECTVVEISDGTLTFTMPAGRLKKPKLVSHLASPSTPILASELRHRSISEDASPRSPTARGPKNSQLKRSNSVHSPRSSLPPTTSRPGTSASDRSSNDMKSNKRRFGIMGSVRRQLSQDSDKGASTGIAKLFKRKPTPQMELVTPIFNPDDSDSPLSDLDDDEFDGQAPPWEDEDGDAIMTVPRKPLPDKSKRAHNGNGTTPTSSARSSQSPDRCITVRRSLPSRPRSEEPPGGLIGTKRPATSGSEASAREMNAGETGMAPAPLKVRKLSGTPPRRAVVDAASLVTLAGVVSPSTLEETILKLDGRGPKDSRMSRHAWRLIRCKRGDKDLGTLWEMREEYYKAKNG